MKNTSFTITEPHLFSHISAFNAESDSYHQTAFQCSRNASYKSNLFPNFRKYFTQDKKIIKILKK